MSPCAADRVPGEAIDAMIRYAAKPVDDDGHTDCYYAGMLLAALRAIGLAESFTGASGEQTTETGTEGPSNPEGLAEGWSYEYRMAYEVDDHKSAFNTWQTGWATKEYCDLVLSEMRRDCKRPWLERRLVGPVERVTEAEA